MSRVKTANVAGKFYTSIKEELEKTIKSFEENHKADYTNSSRLIIVPHAGYNYSGQLAFDGFSYLEKDIKNIFIIAPTHHKSINNLAIAKYDEFETPFGKIKTNGTIQEELINKFSCEYSDNAYEQEHAIEVQLPFIQYLFQKNDIKIVPILVGNDDLKKVQNILEYYYPNKDNAFVISTDLSHFLPLEKTIQIDTLTARMLEDKNILGFRYEQACGAVPLCAVAEFAKSKNFTLIRVGLTNSARVTENNEKVVGYGSWFLYENSTNEFLKKHFAPKMFNIVRKTIEARLAGKSEINITNYLPYPPVFDSAGASFITIEINGILRGCVGSAIAHTQLLVDLIKNANNSAFEDNRFQPLTQEEYNNSDISISLLSPPEPIIFEDEKDLLNKIEKGLDGIIIKDNDKQALYLPIVWEQLPDKKIFLNSLKVKAGLDFNHFSKDFQAFRFRATYIKEAK